MNQSHYKTGINFFKRAAWLSIGFISLAVYSKAQDHRNVKANFGLIYPLSTNGTRKPALGIQVKATIQTAYIYRRRLGCRSQTPPFYGGNKRLRTVG